LLLMDDGSTSEWYYNLNKAPWTPEGWVFGAAWFSIMVFFSFYMTKLALQFEERNNFLVKVFVVQWLLNVSWNYVFFNQHLTITGFVVIMSLWLLVGFFTFNYLKQLKWFTLLIAPYLIWLTIASSLNGYIILYN
ncbi:MAG: tryptophan-rich sensory protein, partial [Polaribacter sp.]|nr:tryptophan-rich sensory protein [Polaribacter sp.]